MKTSRHFFLLVAAVACIARANAHQDTLIQIRDDGSLDGLPTRFSPAKLIVEFNKDGAKPPVLSAIVQLRHSRTLLPACLTQILQIRGKQDIKAHASWYHPPVLSPYPPHAELRKTPPYVAFDFGYLPEKLTRQPIKKHSLMFDLNTSDLIMLTVTTTSADGQEQTIGQIDVATICAPKDLSELRWRPIM